LKAYGGVDLKLHALLISALDGDEWSVSSPGHFNARERSPIIIGWEAGWSPESV